MRPHLSLAGDFRQIRDGQYEGRYIRLGWEKESPFGREVSATEVSAELWKNEKDIPPGLPLPEQARPGAPALQKPSSEIPGPFGLILNADDRTARREGYPVPPVEFGANRRAWEVLAALCQRHPGFLSRAALEQSVWKNATTSDRNPAVQIGKLRGFLKQLGIAVPNKRWMGYRLEEAAPCDHRSPGRKRHRRRKSR
jgi:DNA-binding winged helix-turn-helix (wHTH) protein